ncbi:MAG: NAD+ synthase [Planctomycetaceae bacterium]|nr:NAD+ synthase [Planctomycetaceae bacterium]
MRIALAQVNPTIGDVAGNTDKALSFIDRAVEQGAELVVFPELSVIGYPPKDLLLKPSVIDQCAGAVDRIAQHVQSAAVIVGYPMRSRKPDGAPLHNAAAVCRDGVIVGHRFKHLLPTYDVFDEHRYFEPGRQVDLIDVNGIQIGVSVCEDLWAAGEHFERRLYHDNPINQLAAAGADLFINCSASPFVTGKHELRMAIMRELAREHGLPIVFVNQVGANDELVFDGNSCVVGPNGDVLAHAGDFQEDLLVGDVPLRRGGPSVPSRIETSREGVAAVYHALVLGLGDYCAKCGFDSAVLGLSGGIDSAVCACLARSALGPDAVTGISMPSRYSSDGSKSDAQQLAEALGVTYHTIPLEQPHQAMERTLEPYFAGTASGLAEENVQARLRGVILMSFSNKFGSLLITTGNKSELAVGYCTLYGDMAGGLAVLSDVPKTLVYEVARWINTEACPLFAACGGQPIPLDSIRKPPSAELRPDQTDQDSLPPYEVLDQIIDRYVEREQSVRQIIDETGYDGDLVQRFVRLIDRSEYKRKQAPPGLKVTGRAFGFGRRMPLAMRHEP